MIPALPSTRRLSWKRIWGVTALMLWLGLSAARLQADVAVANPTQDQDFGQYLVDHQDDLAPFFTKNAPELIHESVLMFLGLWERVMFFSLLAGWAIDILLSRWFSAYYAPAFTKFRRAVVYATGRLGLSVSFTFFLGMTIKLAVGLPHFMAIILSLIIIFVIAELIVQAGWVIYVYKTGLPVAAIFYLGIFLVHTVAGILIAAPILGGRANDLVTNFVDQKITPKLQAEVDSAKQEEAKAEAARDQVATQVSDAQKQIALAAGEVELLQKQIEQRKTAEDYLYSQIVMRRAKGDLTGARDQLSDLLTKFPDGAMTDQVKAQLADVNSDLAAQQAQQKQAEADAAAAAAQARSDLLAAANKGQATLSQMRKALMGKAPKEVTALLGDPVETDSDRWGYSQQMIMDPLTGQKYGLTVRFADGVVQGVEYYYGHAEAPQ